jgi:hypothetical protein
MYLVMSVSRIACLFVSLFAVTVVQGEQLGNIDFTGNGFLTVGIGSMLGGSNSTVLGRNCPCFTTDYAQAAIYDGRSGMQWGADSKLGLQGTAALQNSNFSVTAQAVSRGAKNGKIDIEWLYGSYQLTMTRPFSLAASVCRYFITLIFKMLASHCPGRICHPSFMGGRPLITTG